MSNEELVEIVAAIEHEQWMSWFRSLEKRFESLANGYGSLEQLREYFHSRQKLVVDYKDLPGEQKEHDRKWARLKVGAVMDYLLPKGAMK